MHEIAVRRRKHLSTRMSFREKELPFNSIYLLNSFLGGPFCYRTLALQCSSSDEPGACSAVNQDSCLGWDKCLRPGAHYCRLYRMDDGSPSAARQSGEANGGD